MPNPYLSPLRRAASIDPYTDAEQSLRDNAFASPFTRSLQQTVNTDVAGTYRQEALEAQLRGDAVAQRTAEYNRDSALRRMELPAVGPTTFDEARTTGNYGDYVQNVLGSMAGSMVKPLVGASIGGLVGGPLGAAAGGFGGSFSAIRNAELENYANDEQLKTLSPAEQLRVTRNSAALQALPEAIMPAYLGAGGRLPGALNRVPTALRVAGSVAVEGGTEGLQDYISQSVAQSQFPDREIDWGSVRENAIAGLVGGGAMGVLGRHDVDGGAPTPAARPAAGEVSPMDAVPPTDGGGGGVSGLSNSLGERYGDGPESIGEKAKGLAGAVKDRFGDDFESAGEKAKDLAGRATRKAKDIVSETVDRMTEAVKTAENPGDFLSKVFGGNVEDEAAADLSGAPNPMLKGLTFEETEANIARDDAKKATRAARYADELLNDPATPDSIKQRVVDMGGDYTNPDNQAFVARTLVAQRGGEKITKAVQDLVDLGKSAFAKGSEAAGEGLSAAKKAVGDAATAAQDRIVKKNLQSATPAEQAAFGKVIFDGLTDEAKANPLVRAQLAQVTNAMMAFAAKTGDVTAKDLPTLTKLSNAMSLFKDPDAMAQTLVEYAGLPRTEDSFLSRIKRITNAQQDLKQPNSFLVSSLTPEAKSQLTAPQLQRIAQLVDQFTVIDSADSKKGTALVHGLASAFGSPESARAVLDYYSQQNKADLRFDPNEGEAARPRSSDDADDIEGFGTLSEQDAKELVPRFRSPNINRPFFRGRDDAASAVELSRGGDLAQRVSMAEHVRASGDSAKFVAGDIRRDLMKRLNDNISRDTESVREALNDIEAYLKDAPSSGEWAGYSDAVALRNKLRGTKTEDRSAIVKALRDELKALDSAAEKAKRSGKDADEAMLELYDVVLSSPDSSKASDAQMTEFRKLLDTSSDKKTKAENDAIRKTGVTFKIDGKKVAVSLESMVYSSPVRGSIRERLLESLGLVAARADEMPNIPNDAIVKRNYFGKDRHLTWGRLMGMGANPDVKSKARKQFKTDPAKEAIKAELDKVNASSLREHMDKLPKEVDALSAGAELLGRIEGRLAAAKEQMDESPSKVVGDRIRTLSSKRRVLKAYLNEILDADYPVSREVIMDNLESELQAGGIVNMEGQKTEYANILFKEELIQTYRDRADAVKGTSLADDALAKADELTIELDKDLSKLQDFQRMDEMDRPSARSKGVGSTAQKKAMSNEDIQTELAAARAELERVQNADLESFRALAANESDSFLVRQNLSQEKLAKAKEDAIAHAQDMVSRWESHLKRAKSSGAGDKAKKNPAASSRETAKKAQLEDLIRPKAEPGTALQPAGGDIISEVEDNAYAIAENAAKAKYGNDVDTARVFATDDGLNAVYEKAIADADAKSGGAYTRAKNAQEQENSEAVASNKSKQEAAYAARAKAEREAKQRGRRSNPKDAQEYQRINDKVVREAYEMTESQLRDAIRRTQWRYDSMPSSASSQTVDPRSFVAMDLDSMNRIYRERFGEVDQQAPSMGGGAKNPAASSRETAKKVDDAQALSPDAITALHDVAVKENWSRLDTPAKVLRFAAMAAKAREQLKKIPELERTDVQDDLRFKLNDMFKQDGAAAFDWESLWDGLDPTDAQRAQLEGLIRPKAEPGTARPSVILSGKSPYLKKDQAKSDMANKFIGRGSAGSSTASYAKSWGANANVGSYNSSDRVFVSVNGSRPGALAPDFAEIKRATDAGATIIGDTPSDRAREYNSGERAVADFLRTQGYVEKSPGVWVPRNHQKSEPGTTRQSTMKPKRGRPGKIDQQAILDDIARIRGKDVEVVFAKFADIGASGEFSMNKDKTQRLIKIAINSLNPMSVAWHESLHDFMAMLGGSKAERKLKADLLDAAEAPQVMAKLRELLKDHPDALKQIETDREERLAYMYQFWAEGALPLGPTGTGIFSRMVTFFREMLGVLSQDQKIDRLFTALHTGKFSEPSLVGAVLEDLKAQTLGDKARAVAGPIADAAEAMFTGATDRLRNTNVDALIELADMFHREPGRENPAMTQTSSGAKNSFVSNVDSIGRRAAERRLDAGESQESVFKDTGWFKSADGTMIKEVDDSKVFRRVWDTVHKAISTPENMLKLLDAVLDGKDAETLTTTTLADLLRDLGLTEFAKKVGDIEVRFTTGQSNHVVSARRTGVKQVEIGLGYSAMQSGQDVSSIEDRAVRIANSAALTAIHELQHVLQTLDKRTMNDEGPYEQKESEIEAFDTEVRYVQRILNQMLGDDSDLGLPAIARLVAEADMSAGEIAEAFTSPMFIKAGKHKTERTASTKRTTNELPFLQRRAQQVGKRLNKLQEILADTSAEDRRRALENMQAMKPASTPLEKELAAYLKEMRDYMVDRGVKRFDTKTKKWTDLGNVKDYFPRVWDKEAIRNNEAEFINLMEQYIGKAQARETFNALVNGDGSLELAENEHTLGFTPWNPSVLDRQFTFINPSNAAAFAKFQSKDMGDIMTSYTQRAVHRAEYAHTFGNDGEVITKKLLEAQKQGATQDELAMARKATMAMEGTLGYDFNPRLKEVMSGIVTYQNIVLLPLSLFSNLIDPLGIAMRSNDMKEAWKAFAYGMKGIADQLRGAGDDAQTEMSKTLGIIDEQNMLEAMGHVYNSMHMSRFLKNINSKFFRYNGMEMWNRRMRVAAMMAAQRFIISHVENLGSQISHGENKNDSSSYQNHSRRYLDELGITESDVFQLADGTIALTKDQLLQAGAKKSEVSDIEKRIQAAVFKWVDGAVLRPNAAHRPVWGSDPRYQLIFHLKQFTFSFQNTILRRVGEELKHGNVAPGWILMSYVPFMFLSDVLKGSLTGTLNTTADLYDVASQSIARSGIMGTGVFGADAMGDLERGKLPGTSFLGPAFGHLMTLLSGITGHAGVDQVMNRSVPFAKYI